MKTFRVSGLLRPPHPAQGKKVMENLARYIIRTPFSQERMTYFPEKSQVIYRSKDKHQEKIFDVLDWLAAMTSHIPDERMQKERNHTSNQPSRSVLPDKKNRLR